MTIQRILRVLGLFKSEPAPAKENRAAANSHQSPAASPQRTYLAPDSIDRRTAPDRRHLERRRVNCLPYLDTRKNNGRRRSFGRRHRDQDLAMAY